MASAAISKYGPNILNAHGTTKGEGVWSKVWSANIKLKSDLINYLFLKKLLLTSLEESKKKSI